MPNTNSRVLALTLAAATVPLAALTACGSTGNTPVASQAHAPSASAPAAASTEFGPACDAVPSTGPGSFAGMAQDPVATAASHNPVLSTLVSAVQKAGLVDTLNSAKNITVFAPTNDAFAKIPAATLQKVLADKTMLTKILTYHVTSQTITPEQLASGRYTTLQGGALATSGTGTNYTVNDAKVVCGNVHTANATVYIIDTVLMPKN